MTSDENSNGADKWFRIAEAFAAKDSSSADDVIKLVAGLKPFMDTPAPAAPAPAATTAEAPAAPKAEAAPAQVAVEPAPAPTPAPSAEQTTASDLFEQATDTAPEPKAKPAARKTRAKAPAEAKPVEAPKAAEPKPARKKRATKTEEVADVLPAVLEEEEPEPTVSEETTVEMPTEPPAVPIEDALTDEEIFCLECGRGMKMLKRHLGSAHKLTPEEYRIRWDLPEDYPVTAPNYSESKSEYAKGIGFGQNDSPIAPKRRGRKKKSAA
ncbi:MucR family transcriptional regulator [Salipiger sp. PrR003]|uniref:MucR family transcriptional regulator n=1 Tax=Salipiger sp. PrR003 TaxID=2706776 RepID=UPI001F3BC03D|nr:MucR family transcriptional regulator [Salipiger sp. PrR003]